MIRERIEDDIYVFTSKRYAQVTAGAILTKDGVVLIDTLFYPDESREIRDFLVDRLGCRIRYVINTHYHADHTSGTYLYPQANVISHAMCRDLLDGIGRDGLEKMRIQYPEFKDADIILPNIIVKDGTFDISIGGKTIRLIHTPGHSADLMSVFLVKERILFASDTMMPVPTIFDGDMDVLIDSLHHIEALKPDTIVQGHGEVILRGEVTRNIYNNIEYLNKIRGDVQDIIEQGLPASALDDITIESCGKSRIALNGFAVDLHNANLHYLYDIFTKKGVAV